MGDVWYSVNTLDLSSCLLCSDNNVVDPRDNDVLADDVLQRVLLVCFSFYCLGRGLRVAGAELYLVILKGQLKINFNGFERKVVILRAWVGEALFKVFPTTRVCNSPVGGNHWKLVTDVRQNHREL